MLFHINDQTKAIKLATQGVPVRTIAAQLGVTRSVVERWTAAAIKARKAAKYASVASRVARGLTCRQIANELGWTRAAVTNYCIHHEITPTRERGDGAWFYTPAVVARLRGWAELGWTQKMIAAELGRSQSQVSKVLCEHGIKTVVRKLRPVKSWAKVSASVEVVVE